MGYSPGFDTADPDGSPSNRRNLADSGGSLSHTAVGTCSTAVWGVSFVKGCATVAAVDSVSGIDTRGCRCHSWADHHRGPRDGEDTDSFSRSAQYAGTCRVSVSARTHPRLHRFLHNSAWRGGRCTNNNIAMRLSLSSVPLGL